MKQSTLSQKEQEVLKQYFLKEIQKQLKPYTISHTNYFDGELTITNLEQIADCIKFEFEHSAATNRIYLCDTPNSQAVLNEQDLPEFVKCLNLDGKNMHDIIDETGYAFTIITQPAVEIEFPMLGGIGNLKLDYVHYKQSGCKYFACDDGENWSKDDNKRIVSEETRATLASKIKPVDETIPYSRYSPFSPHYHGPQLAGVDDPKWYSWEYELRNTVIGLAYEQINEIISDSKEHDRLNTQLGRIKRNQKRGSRHNKRLWRSVAGISQDIADKTVQAILDFGNEHGVDVFVLEYLDFKGKNIVKRAHFWRYKRIYKVLAQRAHQYGLRIARVNARYTSRLAFDGSGWSKRGREITPETPYAEMQFPTGKTYNADLNASYNIGARYFIRHLLKTVTETQRLALEAKVPQVAKRSTCTLSDLINLRSEFVALTTKTQA